MNVHTRHMRSAIGTREHFEWSANGDSLRELEPAEDYQRELPLAGATVPMWIYPAAGVFAFVAVVLWAGASSPSAPTTAFVASQSSQQAVSTKGFNRFAGDR